MRADPLFFTSKLFVQKINLVLDESFALVVQLNEV